MNKLLKIIVPLLILFAAYGLAKMIAATKEEPQVRVPKKVVPKVDVQEVEMQDHAVSVRSYGTVQSYYETTLTPEVNGRILEISPIFRVGERVNKGEMLVAIDPTNYESALATEKANLTIQQRGLQEEEIRSEQAAEDWKASGRDLSTASEFVLRKPQMAAARANIAAVEAAILKAEADIKRTKLLAPFDAIVAARTASPGNFASSQQSLGTLVATEKAEIRLPLTAEQVRRIELPRHEGSLDDLEGKESKVFLTSPKNPDKKWQAVLTRTEPTVNPQNQVTYVIATVKTPYDEVVTLPVGSFVNAEIPGQVIKDSYQVPEAALVNDSYLWVVDVEDKLTRVKATRMHSEAGSVIVKISEESGKSSEGGVLRVITRPLSNFRVGTKVQEAEVEPEAGEKEVMKKNPESQKTTT